jgi:hypothetical protein
MATVTTEVAAAQVQGAGSATAAVSKQFLRRQAGAGQDLGSLMLAHPWRAGLQQQEMMHW